MPALALGSLSIAQETISLVVGGQLLGALALELE